MTPSDLIDCCMIDSIRTIKVWSIHKGQVVWSGDPEDFADTDYYELEFASWEIGEDYELTFNFEEEE